jgi:hypothetical protein
MSLERGRWHSLVDCNASRRPTPRPRAPGWRRRLRCWFSSVISSGSRARDCRVAQDIHRRDRNPGAPTSSGSWVEGGRGAALDIGKGVLAPVARPGADGHRAVISASPPCSATCSRSRTSRAAEVATAGRRAACCSVVMAIAPCGSHRPGMPRRRSRPRRRICSRRRRQAQPPDMAVVSGSPGSSSSAPHTCGGSFRWAAG